MRYEDFAIRIQSKAEGGYERVGPSGTVEELGLPFPAAELATIPQVFAALREAGAPKPKISAQEIGTALFTSLFAGKIGEDFYGRLATLETRRDKGLRLRLCFDLTDRAMRPLSALPWELLWNEKRADFLSLVRSTPLVRYVAIDRPAPSRLAGPLRILFVQVGAQTKESALDFTAEWWNLWKKLAPHDQIVAASIQNPSLEALRSKLVDETWHVLHFFGHGGRWESSGEGYLVFQDSGGEKTRIPALMLANHLKCLDLRLVFLNACSTATLPSQDDQDLFHATATALLQAGIPAVVAMQGRINYTAALALSAAFYARIAAGDPVDAAAVEGRLAISREYPADWATPVLFSSLPDGDVLRTTGRKLSAKGRPARRQRAPLHLGIRSFPDNAGMIVWDQNMEQDCEAILDLREHFGGPNGKTIVDPSRWQDPILPRLREFLAVAVSARRPIHLSIAAHASLTFAAGYVLEAKSGLDVTIRQRTQAGLIQEWRAIPAPLPEEAWYLPEADTARDAASRDVAFALSVTRPILADVADHLDRVHLPVGRIVPATLAPAPGPTGVRDALHALRLAQVAAGRIESRTVAERRATLHLFASAPHTLLFYLGQLSPGFGRTQLYEHDFRGTGEYTPSLVLPPGAATAEAR